MEKNYCFIKMDFFSPDLITPPKDYIHDTKLCDGFLIALIDEYAFNSAIKTSIIRAFKEKHPESFKEIISSVQDMDTFKTHDSHKNYD